MAVQGSLHNAVVDKNLLPDFLIIGAGKCGTTSLDGYLSQHPEIFMTRMKEPDFFGYETADPSKMEKAEKEHYQRAVKTIEAYMQLYKDAAKHQKKGETSNTSLSSPTAAERIHYYVPDAKLIAIFRQPTKRLFSRYMHLKLIGELPSSEFSDVLDRNSIWWHRKDLVPEGFYAHNISPYFSLFPREQIKIILTEDLHADPSAVVNDIFEFLGVSPYDKINFTVEYNRSGDVKNKLYDKLIGSNSVIKKSIERMLPDELFHKITRIPQLKKVTQYLNNLNLKPASLDDALYKQITEEIYKEDILKLSSLTGRDLSHWLSE